MGVVFHPTRKVAIAPSSSLPTLNFFTFVQKQPGEGGERTVKRFPFLTKQASLRYKAQPKLSNRICVCVNSGREVAVEKTLFDTFVKANSKAIRHICSPPFQQLIASAAIFRLKKSRQNGVSHSLDFTLRALKEKLQCVHFSSPFLKKGF